MEKLTIEEQIEQIDKICGKRKGHITHHILRINPDVGDLLYNQKVAEGTIKVENKKRKKEKKK